MGRTENASFAKDDVGAARDESPRLSLSNNCGICYLRFY